MRTPEQQAADFIAANDKSLVVSGSAIGNGGQGGIYVLRDRTKHRLGRAACKLLPEGYPKWDLRP